MKITCPSSLAYGLQSNVYTDFSSEVIPKGSDLVYELEVISCLNHQSWASQSNPPDVEEGSSIKKIGNSVSLKMPIAQEKQELSIAEKKIK